MVNQCNTVARGSIDDFSMQVAVVDSDVAAAVLHHHQCLVSRCVGGCDFEVVQCDVTCFIERNDAIVFLMLIVGIATGDVVVLVDLDIALAALTFERQGVHASHTFDVGDAHLLIVLAGLDLQRHRTFHAQCADVVDGSLDGGVVAVLPHGVVAALAAGNGDGCRGGVGYVNGSAVDRHTVERSRGGLSYLGGGLHVVGQPEVVGSTVSDLILGVEHFVGRE